ncbi:hypothetical protein SCHPADRAFT_1001921 [Schizopora paradoxa]|uniref:PH domain-containing protein n=1 Tax=Schizopora paradoxa TaxID=27342 RepID=A0A0H2R6V3_9AGAM|nr:hypothetical protein SCHPADRAFT_1001921 [Schizopora paradoxa]
MATFSDGRALNGNGDLNDDALASTGSMRQHLNRLLESKDSQIQQAVTLGHRVVAQRAELEERIRQLQTAIAENDEDDDVNIELRMQYRDLMSTLGSWDDENTVLTGMFGGKDSSPLSPSLTSVDLPHEHGAQGSSATTASQSRRAKNAARRANDVEFATEIGNNLLREVRRLQSLLGERDKAIQDMKEEKDDLEKTVENMRTGLRTQEQDADKYKEENWNLEVTLQELRAQLTESQGSLQRSEAEGKRLTKALASARETSDATKSDNEKLTSQLNELKAKHETNVALHRRATAQAQREKSDLQSTIDALKADAARASRRLVPRFGSPSTPGMGPGGPGEGLTPAGRFEDDDDVFNASVNRRKMDNSALLPPDFFANPESAESSPDPSPSKPFKAPNHPANEIEALQQKLAHAQRQIGTLKGTLAREKELRMSYRRSLTESGANFKFEDEEGLDEEEEDEGMSGVDEMGVKRPRRAAPARRGRGRATPGITRTARRGMQTPSDLANETSPLDVDNFPTTYLPELPDLDIEDDSAEALPHQEDPDMSMSVTASPQPPSNRTSIDGMDPAFANVLRSNGSRDSFGSPVFIRGTIRGGRGGTVGSRRRGGVGYQEARPSSIVGAADVLAAEFGIGMDSVTEDREETREFAEFACQTDPVEPLPPPPPILVTPETVDSSMQTDPEPVPEVPEVVEAVPIPVPVVERADAGQQTEPEPTPPVLVSVSMETDPEPVPEPPVERVFADSFTETDPVVVPLSSEMSVQTEEEEKEVVGHAEEDVSAHDEAHELDMRPSTPVKTTSEAQTQTTPRAESFFSSTTDTPRASVNGPAAIGSGYSRLRYLSSASTVTGIRTRNSIHQIVQAEEDEDEEDARTELAADTETETETDMDDYHDARSVVAPTPTATESVNDFHSMSTVSDNEFSSDEGGEDERDEMESVKASIMKAGGSSRASSMMDAAMLDSDDDRESYAPVRQVTYDSQSVQVSTLPAPEPKKEVAEVSVQTDEWQPEPPADQIAGLPKGFGLYRVGSASHQFQFVSPGGTASQPMTPISPTLSSPNASREANTTARPIRFSSASLQSELDRRKSIDSAASASGYESGTRQHTVSLGPAVSPTIDRTKPPTITLPPPPRMPPPPGSMPPPSFIPDKRRPASSLGHREGPPPRPSSPPPPELIQRATTPTFGTALGVPGRGLFNQGSVRQHGSSLPPNAGSMRQPPSTNSFRSAANAASFGQASGSSLTAAALLDGRVRGINSASSLLSDQEDAASHRSSISSDFHPRDTTVGNATISAASGGLPSESTPGRAANISSGSTDPSIIHAITQTMIGEFLFKYTRRAIGKGHGERRHKRFFWVHPYTRTLYWSSADPGSTNVSEASAKSAYIESVRAILDPNPMPPGLYQYSVVISTPQREMKITAPTKERHEIWLNALQYLLARPAATVMSPGALNGAPPVTPNRKVSGPNGASFVSPMSQRSTRSEQSGMSGESGWNVTPRGRSTRSRSRVSIGGGGSVGKRAGTPAAEYMRWTSDGPASPGALSLNGFEYVDPNPGEDDDDLDFEIHDSTMQEQEGDAFEGMENVRACCDGRHTVGRAGHDHHHHHHHDQHHHHFHHPPPPPPPQQPSFLSQRQHSLNANSDHLHPSRPVSPAFSMRSRASSKSREGGGVGSLFSRFGSRRTKGSIPTGASE